MHQRWRGNRDVVLPSTKAVGSSPSLEPRFARQGKLVEAVIDAHQQPRAHEVVEASWGFLITFISRLDLLVSKRVNDILLLVIWSIWTLLSGDDVPRV